MAVGALGIPTGSTISAKKVRKAAKTGRTGSFVWPSDVAVAKYDREGDVLYLRLDPRGGDDSTVIDDLIVFTRRLPSGRRCVVAITVLNASKQKLIRELMDAAGIKYQ